MERMICFSVQYCTRRLEILGRKDQTIFTLKHLGYRTIYCNYQQETEP